MNEENPPPVSYTGESTTGTSEQPRGIHPLGAIKRRWNRVMNAPVDENFRAIVTAKPVIESIKSVGDQEDEVSGLLDKIHAKLEGTSFTRRQVVAGGAVAGALMMDEYFLHGLGRYYLKQLASNGEFREKLWDSIQSGEIIEEDIPRLVREIVGGENYDVELSERVSHTEPWLDNAFTKYEVRKVLRNQKDDGHLLLIADIDAVNIIEAESVSTETVQGATIADYVATAREHPNMAVLPRSQMSKSGYWGSDDVEYLQLTPRMWTSFVRKDGSIYEQKDADGTRNFRGGALVVDNNQLHVVDSSDLGKYTVGENCQGIQVCAYTVRSQHKAEDLKAIDDARTLSGLSPDDPMYCSFVVTFNAADGSQKTHLVSVYNRADPQTGEVVGATWEYLEQLNATQVSQICDQILEEKGYQDYIIAVPDPDEFSALLGPDIYSDETVQSLAARGNFSINKDTKYYQPGLPFARSLWSQPYAQAQVPLMFIAAVKP